jgi:hypothetical protein
MIEIRKVITTREAVFSERGVKAVQPTVGRGNGGYSEPVGRSVRRRSETTVQGRGDARQ